MERQSFFQLKVPEKTVDSNNTWNTSPIILCVILSYDLVKLQDSLLNWYHIFHKQKYKHAS